MLELQLQQFAEDEDEKEVEASKEEAPKTFSLTQDEIEELLDKQKQEFEEAKKLEQMSKEDKENYELSKLKQQLADYQAKEQQRVMSKQVAEMLSEKSINVSDVLCDSLVRNTALETKQAVNAFADEFKKQVDEEVKRQLSGTIPKVSTTTAEVKDSKNSIAELFNHKQKQNIKSNWG